MSKTVAYVKADVASHWVGNGFPVSNYFHYRDDPQFYSPFLLLDYVAPHRFEASSSERGVGEHPHRGIETVTIAFSGEITHRDSNGGHGTVTEGGVQWMTAGRGIVHEEMHSRDFRMMGGTLEMIQLWTNLPKTHKMTAPRYQALAKHDLPSIDIGIGHMTLIAGNFSGMTGPAQTVTPMDVGLVDIKTAGTMTLDFKEGYSALLLLRQGEIELQNHVATAPALVVLSTKGQSVNITAKSPAAFAFFSGEPIREPIVGQGPFVMNTREEIMQAFNDYENGLMGHLE